MAGPSAVGELAPARTVRAVSHVPMGGVSATVSSMPLGLGAHRRTATATTLLHTLGRPSPATTLLHAARSPRSAFALGDVGPRPSLRCPGARPRGPVRKARLRLGTRFRQWPLGGRRTFIPGFARRQRCSQHRQQDQRCQRRCHREAPPPAAMPTATHVHHLAPLSGKDAPTATARPTQAKPTWWRGYSGPRATTLLFRPSQAKRGVRPFIAAGRFVFARRGVEAAVRGARFHRARHVGDVPHDHVPTLRFLSQSEAKCRRCRLVGRSCTIRP